MIVNRRVRHTLIVEVVRLRDRAEPILVGTLPVRDRIHILLLILDMTVLFRRYHRQATQTRLALCRKSILITKLGEERVLYRAFRGDSLGWLKLEHLAEEVEYVRIVLVVLAQIAEAFFSVGSEIREYRFLYVWQLVKSLPNTLIWCPKESEDLEELVDLALPLYHRLIVSDLEEDAAQRPDVDGSAVHTCPQQHFRGSVP